MARPHQPEKGKSPYVRYGKRPHVYSPTYQHWRSATIAGRRAEADRHAIEHERQFGYRRNTAATRLSRGSMELGIPHSIA